ncbi:conserved hypothetical protein [Altererythrobacter sp. B11]|uniref:hypothetical protein n=1 Tax=Altererythrobacter sp. B11 TaxID=2060312 RepID=UPI000DC703BE|nr:hypothetical protein [Altererythrobacter sp. B11]BBC71651.1 conserved hypothetical protein [Altererythrobacter sp. B11]
MTLIESLFSSQDLSHVLLLAMFASVGLIAGMVWAEYSRYQPNQNDLTAPAAAGVLFALVAVGVMPSAQADSRPWLVSLLLLFGSAAYVLLGILSRYIEDRWVKSCKVPGDVRKASGGTISAAAIVDLMRYGLVLGAAAAASATSAIMVATALILVNISGARRTFAGYHLLDLRRMDGVAILVLFALVFISVALLVFWSLHGWNAIDQAWTLIFLAGFLLAASAKTLLEHDDEKSENHRKSLLAFIVGFATFALFTAALATAFKEFEIPQTGLEHPKEQSTGALGAEQASGAKR